MIWTIIVMYVESVDGLLDYRAKIQPSITRGLSTRSNRGTTAERKGEKRVDRSVSSTAIVVLVDEHDIFYCFCYLQQGV